MNLANELARSIMGKDSPDACSIEELQQLVNRHPWFAPAQLLLAQKLKSAGSPQFEKQEQRLSVYISNPIWLQDLLSPAITEAAVTPEKEMEIIEPLFSEKIITAELEQPFTKEEVVIRTEEKEEEEELVTVEEEDEQEEQNLPELSIRMPELKIEPINPATAELSFEPYHTIDYFASQGIRVREDEKPKDRFSEQLKSFTDWLKTIKKVPVTEIAAATSVTDEKKVEQMAEKSITDREVITEAMAEVWEKQGDMTKAADIYRKLSLLDPAKSSYFAAKIEQLKHL